MRKVIIYGGAGFIGSALSSYLCTKGIEVWIVEKKGLRNESRYQQICLLPVHIIECDLEEIDSLEKIILIHFISLHGMVQMEID